MDTLRLYLVTWNVATHSPSQDLNSLLDFPSQYDRNRQLPDFYVIGLQEVKSQPQNLLLDSLFSDPWTTALNRVLCQQGYVSVKTIRLQGLLLVVYSQIKHLSHLRDIEAQYTKTGLGGVWGNKGAVSVRFNIYGCSVCLVNCHLAAHEHLLADRVQDYNTIVRSHTFHVGETTNIMYHDYVFWIGDLNFRTDHPTGNSPTAQEIADTLAGVEKDKYESLLRHDQLLAVMQSGDAFSEFKEPEIRFPPTYKFDVGGDTYDLKRKPSWTDRILYKVVPDNYENITLRADNIAYNHLPHYTLSDHKPVFGQYTIKTFSNYTEKTVEFAPVTNVWFIGDADFRTQCTLSADVEVNPNDWIGIYDANFHSLDDYIAYEYLAKVSVDGAEVGEGEGAGSARTITLSFPVGSGVRTPGFYRFIYFSQPNGDVRSVLGVSEPFEVSSKGEHGLSVEPCAGASRSPPRSPAPHSDLFSDFAALDVANLSRHFANDLNID